MKSNISNLSRTIGNIFLPIVAKTIPYINGFVIALQRLAEYIVKLLGFEGFKWGGIGGGDSDILSNLYDDADNLSDSLGDATANAKKLKNELMGFDEINKLSDNTDTDGAGVSGIDALSSGLLDAAFNDALNRYQQAWNEAFDNMENKANSVADNIIKSFKSGDFYGIGTYISTSLRDALDGIDWDSVYEGAGKFSEGLAEFLNGLIRPDTFHLVGKTIANTLNTTLHSKLVFAENFDWINLGDSLAGSVNGFFENFDFAQFANTLDAWVQGLASFIIEFITGIEWSEVLKGAWDILTNIDLETVAIVISAFTIKYKITTLIKAITTKLLPKLTAWFAAHSATFLKIGVAITILTVSFELAKDKFKPIYEEYDLEEIKNASEEMFSDWLGKNPLSLSLSDTFVSLGTLIVDPKEVGNAFKLMWQDIESGDFKLNIGNMFELPSWNEFKDSLKLLWEDVKKGDFKFSVLGLFELPSVNELKKIGKNIIKGILNGFEEKFTDIKETAQKFYDKVIEKIKEVFGIHSPAKNMNSLGENILLGIVEGFTNKIEEFKKAISNWWENDVKPWFTISKWSGLFSNIKTSLINKWNETVDSWKTKITNWWNNDVSPWFTLTKWSNLFGNIKTAIVTKWTEITNWWENTAIFQWWRDDVKPWFTVEKWEETVGGIKTAFSNIFDNIIESAKTWGSDMIDGFVQGIEDAGETLEEGVKKAAKKIKKFLHFSRPDEGPLRDYETWMPDFMKGLAKGISDNEYLVTNSIKSLASNMANLQDYTVDVQPNYSLPNMDYISARQIYDVNQTNTTSFIGSDITNGVREANAEQNELLKEQNELLRALLAKDTGISARDIFNSVRNSATDYTIRTGMSPFPV